MNHCCHKSLFLVCLIAFSTVLSGQSRADDGDTAGEKLKALIVDGQNNHNVWPKSTFGQSRLSWCATTSKKRADSKSTSIALGLHLTALGLEMTSNLTTAKSTKTIRENPSLMTNLPPYFQITTLWFLILDMAPRHGQKRPKPHLKNTWNREVASYLFTRLTTQWEGWALRLLRRQRKTDSWHIKGQRRRPWSTAWVSRRRARARSSYRGGHADDVYAY